MLPRLVVVSLLGSLSLAGTACSSCQPQKPSLTVKGATIAAADFDGATIDVEVEVANSNAFPIAADAVTFEAQLEGKPAAKGALKKRIAVTGKTKELVKMPVRVRYADLGAALDSMASTSRWKFTVTGVVELAPIQQLEQLALRLPFSTTGSINAPRLPTVQVKSSRLENVSLKAATVVIELLIVNENSFALPAGSFNGALTLGAPGSTTVAGTAKVTVPSIAKNDRAVVVVRQPISLVSLGSAALAIAAGKSVDGNVDGSFRFGNRTLAWKKTVPLSR